MVSAGAARGRQFNVCVQDPNRRLWRTAYWWWEWRWGDKGDDGEGGCGEADNSESGDGESDSVEGDCGGDKY